ncbi:MAG TPA: hypothetical protein VFR94_11740 [Nitrososphaeraceae archaeon]|nr:hypothetical protein [Nitrososphaeraceae archaeon]
MRYINTKSKNNRSILGISGILLLILGLVSLIFQYSTTVDVYAQVGVGPFIPIGPPFRSTAIDTVQVGTTTSVAYAAQQTPGFDPGVYLAFLDSVAGENAGTLRAPPANIIVGGADPAIAGGGNNIFVTATRGGQGDIAITECTDNEDTDSEDNCEEAESASTPNDPPVSDAGPDQTVNEGNIVTLDGTGSSDPNEDIPLTYEWTQTAGPSVELSDPSAAQPTFTAPEVAEGSEVLTFNLTATDSQGLADPTPDSVTINVNDVAEPPVGIEGEGSSTEESCRDSLDNDGDRRRDLADPDCKWASEEESTVHGLCSDGQDNDGDRVTDSDDEDCFHPAETGGAADTAETGGAADNDTAGVEPTSFNLQPGTTSSPQLTFVSTDGGDAPSASNSDVAASSDGDDVYIVWEQDEDIMFRAGHGCADANGCEFGDILNLSNNAGRSTEARVATSSDGTFVHVAWQDNTSGNDEILYQRSTNGGETFNGGSPIGSPINLSNTSGISNDHQLVAEGTNVYVVWVDFTSTSFGGEIYFRKIGNNGDPGSISNTINLSAGIGQSFKSSRDPDMAAQGDRVVVTWAAKPDRAATRAGEIIVRESSDSGSTFDQHSNASQTPRTDSKEPQVDYIPESTGEIYVAFHDTGGPTRVFTTPGKYNVLATERDNGSPFSALVNLSDAENNPDPGKDTSQLLLVEDVAIWDPTSRRG